MVREKNARCTPKPSSDQDCGPASPSRSASRSLPSAVIRYVTRDRRERQRHRVDVDDRVLGGDVTGRLQPAQRRIERAEAEGPERAEGGVEPFAQLVAVHRGFGEQAEDGQLEDGGTFLGDDVTPCRCRSDPPLIEPVRDGTAAALQRPDYIDTIHRACGHGRSTPPVSPPAWTCVGVTSHQSLVPPIIGVRMFTPMTVQSRQRPPDPATAGRPPGPGPAGVFRPGGRRPQRGRRCTGRCSSGSGLTHPQYLVMLALWQHAPLSVKRLAELLQLDPGTLSPLLKRLEAAELITRRRDAADERLLAVELTDRVASCGTGVGRAAGGDAAARHDASPNCRPCTPALTRVIAAADRRRPRQHHDAASRRQRHQDRRGAHA